MSQPKGGIVEIYEPGKPKRIAYACLGYDPVQGNVCSRLWGHDGECRGANADG